MPREIEARLRAVLAATDAYHALAAAPRTRYDSLFLRDDRSPHVYDVNHVRNVRTRESRVVGLLDQIEIHYRDRSFRSVRTDARVRASSLEARLALAGYAPVAGELLMVLEGDVRGRAADLRIAAIADDAAWAAWREVKARDARTPWFAPMADEWVAHLRRKAPAVVYLGAFEGPDLLGFFSHFVHERVGYLEDLLVSPAARRRGVATALVVHAVAAARRRGARLVFLPAATDDSPKAMYAAMGFAPVGTAWSWLRRVGSESPSKE